jgi:hypothetical protein
VLDRDRLVEREPFGVRDRGGGGGSRMQRASSINQPYLTCCLLVLTKKNMSSFDITLSFVNSDPD